MLFKIGRMVFKIGRMVFKIGRMLFYFLYFLFKTGRLLILFWVELILKVVEIVSVLFAVIHRDYNFNGSILISLFDNRIEIVSLGGLVKGISIKDIFNGVSETRNPNLANIFYRLKYVESFGTGIERIMETYQEYYDKRPIFQNTENTFKVILYNINYESEDVINNFVINEEPVELDANLLLEKYLKKNKVINRASLQEILNISKTSAVNLLNKMIKDGKIMQVGEGKNTFYILK